MEESCRNVEYTWYPVRLTKHAHAKNIKHGLSLLSNLFHKSVLSILNAYEKVTHRR